MQEQVVPRAKQAPGFVAGYWTRSADESNGLAMVVFGSEDSANAATQMIRAAADTSEGVTLDDVEVREVVAQAG